MCAYTQPHTKDAPVLFPGLFPQIHNEQASNLGLIGLLTLLQGLTGMVLILMGVDTEEIVMTFPYMLLLFAQE